MSQPRIRLLVVGEKAKMLAALSAWLAESKGHLVQVVTDVQQTIHEVHAAEEPYSVALIDESLPTSLHHSARGLGIELMGQIKAFSPLTEVIFVAPEGAQWSPEPIRAGAFHYLIPPLEPDGVARLIHEAFTSQTKQAKPVPFDVNQLEGLRRTTLAMTSPMNGQSLLQTIIQQAVELLKVKDGGIYEYDAQQNELTVVADYGRPEYLGKSLKVGEGMAGKLVLHNASYMIVNNYDEWPGKSNIYTEYPVRAVLEVPLQWEDNLLGVLYLDDEVGRLFTEQEGKLLRTFADQAAITLINKSLLTENQKRIKRLERLSHATKEILAATTVTEGLNLIAYHAAKLLNAESCGVLLVKRAGYLSLEASYGHREYFSEQRDLKICNMPRGGLTGHIAYQKKLFNAHGNALATHPATRNPSVNHTPSGAGYSLLAIPLMTEEAGTHELLGLLRVDNKKGKDGHAHPTISFNEEDEWLLNIFAEVVVVAIKNANLVQERNEQRSHLQRLINSSPMCIIANNNAGYITGFNKSAQKMLGYSEEEARTMSVGQLFKHPQRARQIGQVLGQEPEHQLLNYETLLCNKAGEEIPIRLSAMWLQDAQEKRLGTVGYFEDLRAIRQIEQHLELLLKASNLLIQADNLKQGLQKLAKMLISLLDHTFCRILLLDENEQFLHVQAACIQAQQKFHWRWAASIVPSEKAILKKLLETSHPIQLHISQRQHKADLAYFSAHLHLKEQIQSLLIVPLRSAGSTIGWLEVGELRQNRSFSLQTIQLLDAIAAQISALIERVRLHESTERDRQLLAKLDEANRHIRAEKEPIQLQQEIVRLAVQLVNGTIGVLYLYHPKQEQLGHARTYGLTSYFIGPQFQEAEAVATYVAQAGEPQVVWLGASPERLLGFKSIVALPLKQAGIVLAVLLLAHQRNTPTHQTPTFSPIDFEILKRFASQAALTLQTSHLISQEKRMTKQLFILHKISDYIQAAGELDKILHVVLTGITAGYGLGFNRAVLLLLDDKGQQLIGRMGIGDFNEQQARRAWNEMLKDGLDDFKTYLKKLEQNVLPLTAIGQQIDGLCLPLDYKNPDILTQAVLEKRHLVLKPDQLCHLPRPFLDAFEPAWPLIVVPFMTRDNVIGLLVADNKFTRAPITPSLIESLLTFANTAAIAISNRRLFDEMALTQQRLHAFYEASNAFVTSQEPAKVLQETVEKAQIAAHASSVGLILIDELGQACDLITVGFTPPKEISKVTRPTGISIQVMRSGVPVVIEDTSQEVERVNPWMFTMKIAAALCLPLFLEGQAIGVLWLHYDKPRHFSNTKIKAVQLYANQAVIAYENARQLKELEHMRQAAEALASARTLSALLKQIVKSSRDVLQADSASIWPYDAIGGDQLLLSQPVAAGMPEEPWQEYLKETKEPSTGKLIIQKGWLAVHSIDKHSSLLGHSEFKLLIEVGVRSFQGIALIVGEEPLGVLYVNYNRPRRFSSAERKKAHTFANHAALALKNAHLLAQLSKVRNVAQEVAKVTLLEESPSTLQSVVEGTCKALRCDAVTLYVFDQQKQQVHYPPIMSGVRYPERAIRRATIPPDSIIFQMLKHNQMHVVHNVAQDALFKDRRFSKDEEIVSCVAIPLKVGAERVGVMFVNYRTFYNLTIEDQSNIQLFANQAAVAIRNTQLFEQVQKRAVALQALYEAGRTVTASLNLGHILATIAEQAWQLTGINGKKARFVHIAIVQANKLLFKAAFPPEHLAALQTSVGHITLKEGQRIGITGRAVKQGTARLVDDVTNDPDYITYDPQTHSALAVPIKVEQKVIGVINVEHPEPSVFDQADQQALQALAGYAAIAIQNARRFEQIKRAAERLTTVHQHFDVTSPAKKMHQEILQVAIEEMVAIFKVEQGCVLMFDWEQGYGWNVIAYPKTKEQTFLIPLKDNASMGWLFAHRQPLAIDDTRSDPRVVQMRELIDCWTVKSMLLVPILIKRKVSGAMLLYTVEEQRIFSPEEQHLAQIIANHITSALDNAGLHAERNKRISELERTKKILARRTSVAWMGMIAAHWRHAIEGHAMTIAEETDNLRSDFSREELTTHRSKQLDKIERLAKQIVDKNMTPPLSTEEGVVSVTVNGLLRERLAQLWQNGRYDPVQYRFKVFLDHKITVRISPEWFRRAFDLLIDNAVEALTDALEKYITVTTTLYADSVIISVSDTGSGIPADVQDKLFAEPISKSKGDKGLGIGLLMAQTIIEAYGGELELESTGEKGTTMVIRLPQE